MTDKTFIANREGNKLCVVITKGGDKGLIFIEHGLTSTKDKPHIRLIAERFAEIGYTAVTFDNSNGVGESGGNTDNITFTSHHNDLCDVINWAKSQDWYKEPFALAGHSLGGGSVIRYAETHPDDVNLLIPISPATSGKNMEEATRELSEADFKKWRDDGYYIRTLDDGRDVKVPFTLLKDFHAYDGDKAAKNIRCPTVVITGDKDDRTPLKHVTAFYNALTCKKELKVLPDCPHTFRDARNLKDFDAALQSILRPRY